MINDTTAPGKRHCPHCQHEISVKEAITILRATGAGALEFTRVRSPNGIEAILEIGEVNPFLTEVIEM